LAWLSRTEGRPAVIAGRPSFSLGGIPVATAPKRG
jgi:hypothetical protein